MSQQLTPSAQYAITLRLECPHQPGWIARISGVIAAHGGAIGAIDLVHIHKRMSLRDYTVECASTTQAHDIEEALRGLQGVRIHSVSDKTFLMHLGGKLETVSRVPLKTRADLSMAYTPGVARICRAIQADPRTSFSLTLRRNTVAVISDGSAVLGLGNIGAAAAMPVMEGKAILFKEFGGVDAFPLCLDTQDSEEIVRFCRCVAPSFGAINLEDIAAPRCFAVESALQEQVDIPVFHDDQHGTAVVVLAAAINAFDLTGLKPGEVSLVVSGAGAAAFACIRTLHRFGIGNIVACDRQGAIHSGRRFQGNAAKEWLARHTNPEGKQGSLRDVLPGARMFLGLSAPGLVRRCDVERMAPRPIIFAMSNPTPEVMPEEVADLAAVMATGRSDYPNQINNVLAFPGIFRGALDARAGRITEAMKQAAAAAIAAVVEPDELSPEYIIPSVFNRKVVKAVAAGVARAARRDGVARRLPKTGPMEA